MHVHITHSSFERHCGMNQYVQNLQMYLCTCGRYKTCNELRLSDKTTPCRIACLAFLVYMYNA